VPPTARLFSPAEAARVWHVREQALAATVFVPGEPHGWEGWEDSAVPPARLGAYLRSLFALLDRYGYRTPMYGHFGQGCVHMRINFDFGSAAGIARFRSFLDEAAEVVLAHGGSLSGEHGDGQARAALLPRMFGAELMEAFGEFKRIWDPDNRMNPGKLVDLERVYEPTENLRLGRGEEREPARLALAGDGGSLARAVSRCVGVGACRKTDRGTMCPSYMATREEAHSTRGRARLLWEMLEGSLAGEGWRSEAVRESLDLCLACKACKSECPVNVDMAGYKAEFLSHYYEGRLHPPRHYLFGHMDRLAHLGSLAPRLGNGVLSLPGAAGALRALLGIAPERALPRLAARSFQSQRRRRAPGAAPPAPAVVLWPDTWNNYYYPQALAAAARLLEAAGLGVRVPRGHVCCGRPLYDFGFLDEARTYLERVLRRFAGEIEAGMPFVFLEPSCASVFRDELLELFPDSEPARRLAAQTRLLADVLEDRSLPLRLEGEHLVHGHCHHRAVFDLRSEARVLAAAGASVRVLDAGCCGMAGPFGFEAKNYQVSMAVGERGLLPEVRRATPGTVIVSDGFSCREQVRHGSGREAVHFAEALARGL
jgi:Fe-S oxidoreductase